MEKYDVSYADIGRLEVGTETIIDKSKSVKSVLMQLFVDSGNSAVEGVDTTNACYGGTSALFNAVNWVESSSWDGRLALVVAGDIAVYASGSARPTGGAGCVAMLVGPDAPLAVERGLRGTHMDHVYDFYKPDLSSEFPEVDGKLSVECYLKSVDICYHRYLKKLENAEGVKRASLEQLDYFVFHAPFSKQVIKAYARLAYNDYLRSPDDEKYSAFRPFFSMSKEDSYNDRSLMATCLAQTKQMMTRRVEPGLLAAKQLGNMYCASKLPVLLAGGGFFFCVKKDGGIASLISEIEPDDLLNKRIAVFSYGSGLASSIFSFRV
ncbi:MAG: hydroxymethylglutaryl-coenzyme A synthase C terminal-domain-containing protein, partial [Olpidium bornovanus]